MTWKKTALNSHSKIELIELLAKTCKESKSTISVTDFYTNGTIFSDLTKGSCDSFLMIGMNSQKPSALLKVLGGKKLCVDDFQTESGMEKIAHCTRGFSESEYSLVISPVLEKNAVHICAVGKRRVYMRVCDLTGDQEKDSLQVGYHAIYELTRLVFNEVKEHIPTQERGIVL